MKFARIGQPNQILHFDGEPALHNGFRNGVAGDRCNLGADWPDEENRDNAEQDPNTHKPSRYSVLGMDHSRSATALSLSSPTPYRGLSDDSSFACISVQ